MRVAGATPEAPDVYSPMQAGWTAPRRFRPDDVPVWAAHRRGPTDARASFHGERIRAELAADDPQQLVLDREFVTQSIDPMFLEPEAGLGWYDGSGRMLELVLGVQSPQEAAESVAFLLGSARGPFRPSRIHTHFAHVGGGFGGRDHTIFPLYVALAAMFFPDRPVRLANNRYEQFQSDIKRHAFRMRSRIGVDRSTEGSAPSPPTTFSTAAGSPPSPPASPMSAQPAPSASTISPGSTSPRSPSIRAVSPPGPCAASEPCRR